MADVLLKAENVSLRYPSAGAVALQGVELNVEAGSKIALIGENGSGKTTLLLAIVGLLELCGGSIEVDGIRVSRKNLEKIRSRIGFLFSVADDQILFPRVLDDVVFGLRKNKLGMPEALSKAREMLHRLEIRDLEDRSPHHLSLGQRKRVALAGTLVTAPRLLLLDEPSAGLDPRGKWELAELLRSLDSAAVLATHDLDFAARCCERALVLRCGKIVDEIRFEGALTADVETRILSAMYEGWLQGASRR